MNTAEEKATEWIKSQNLIYSDNMIKSLALLLKEQDRDTRHACAEAVNRIALDHNTISQAHNAVMNTKAV